MVRSGRYDVENAWRRVSGIPWRFKRRQENQYRSKSAGFSGKTLPLGLTLRARPPQQAWPREVPVQRKQQDQQDQSF